MNDTSDLSLPFMTPVPSVFAAAVSSLKSSTVFLGCDALSSDRSSPVFQSIVLPPSSWPTSFWFLSLLFDPEGGCSTFLEMSMTSAVWGITSQMIVLLIVTAEKTLNPT
jgi:hypothetical protein